MPVAAPGEGIRHEELQLAARNAGMPLEVLRDELTPAGLHYLLVHYDIPALDADAFELRVDGAVASPLRLGMQDLQRRPHVTRTVTMECAGNGRARLEPRPVSQPWLHEAVGTAVWTGTPLAGLLREAGVDPAAVEVVFWGADRGVEAGAAQRYARSLSVDDALDEDVLLAWDMGGAPLLPQHGFPLRLVVPGWYGMASVKWLTRVEVVTEPFAGYQNAVAYRYRTSPEDPGTPVTRMAVRSLMAPPGVPEFPSRRRFVELAPQELVGRAWSAAGPVVRVEVTDDGGATWVEARVDPPPDAFAWQRWTCTWTPRAPGDLELWCRATDASGATQPLEPVWNVGGYAVNAVHRVPVTVVAGVEDGTAP